MGKFIYFCKEVEYFQLLTKQKSTYYVYRIKMAYFNKKWYVICIGSIFMLQENNYTIFAVCTKNISISKVWNRWELMMLQFLPNI